MAKNSNKFGPGDDVCVLAIVQLMFAYRNALLVLLTESQNHYNWIICVGCTLYVVSVKVRRQS